MSKKLFILFILLILWGLSFFIPKAKAESPFIEISIPQEIQGDEVKEYAYRHVVSTWGTESWESFYKIIHAESRWNPNAQNPKSSAFGLGQFLSSTWKSTGIEKTNDPYQQIDGVIIYIHERYDDPVKAWNHWQKMHWY